MSEIRLVMIIFVVRQINATFTHVNSVPSAGWKKAPTDGEKAKRRQSCTQG